MVLTNVDLSLEFLMGRALDNSMLAVGQKDAATSTTSTNTMSMDKLTHDYRGFERTWFPHGRHY
jgi:hypothetical protein